MNSYDTMYNSLMKNIQEFSEFAVDELGCYGYYDLVDRIIDLYNFKISVYKEDKKLFSKIEKDLRESEEDK